jgi:cell division protein FtsL
MRVVLIFAGIVIYLFLLVYIESELVKIEVRKDNLQHRMLELENQKKALQFEIMNLSNLAIIEEQAKQQGFTFPGEDDILGVIK